MTTIIKKLQFKKAFGVSGETRPLFLTKNKGLLGIVDPFLHNTEKNFWTPLFNEQGDYGAENSSIARSIKKCSQTGYSFSGLLENGYPFIEVGTYRTDAPSIKTNINLKNGDSNESCFLYFPIANGAHKLKEAPVIFTYNRYGESFVVLFDFRDKALKELIELLYLGKNPYDFVQDNFSFKREIKNYYQFSILDTTMYTDEELGEEGSLDLKIEQRHFDVNIAINGYDFRDYRRSQQNRNLDLTGFTVFNYHKHRSVFNQKEWADKPSFFGDLGVKVLEHNQDLYYLIIGKYGEVVKYFTDLSTLFDYLGVEQIEVNSRKYCYYIEKGSSYYREEHKFTLIEAEKPHYEYEILVSSLELLFNDIEVLIKTSIENIELKKKKDKELRELYQKVQQKRKEQKQALIKILSENKDSILNLQDSYDVGNCIVGTKKFISQFFSEGLEEIKVSEILECSKIEEMLDNDNFIRVVLNKFKRELEVPQ